MADEECKCPPPGLPAWMGTFADLMSLLMCFFVLLLSFSEMDAMKFKRLAGSMKSAFGVQAKLKVLEVPKGTSIVAQEFSPAKPEPTPINEIWQKTEQTLENTLTFECSKDAKAPQEDIARKTAQEQSEDKKKRVEELEQRLQELLEQTQQDAVELAQALAQQISTGEVEIETRGRKIIIRIKEKGSFASGSAVLNPKYRDVLEEVAGVVARQPGMVSIQGHTDNIPIRTQRYRSNWDLSAARASSVAMELLASGALEPKRIAVTGLAETRPLASNNNAADRARNRRVEIVLQQGLGDVTQADVDLLRQDAPDVLRALEIDMRPAFELSPDEVF